MADLAWLWQCSKHVVDENGLYLCVMTLICRDWPTIDDDNPNSSIAIVSAMPFSLYLMRDTRLLISYQV